MRIGNRLIFLDLVDVDVVQAGEFAEVRVIDHAERKELADTWFGDAVLELGQPAIRNAKTLVPFYLSDSAARLLHLPHSDIAAVPESF